ncbi:unnamed protein product [Boreogadus saida]
MLSVFYQQVELSGLFLGQQRSRKPPDTNKQLWSASGNPNSGAQVRGHVTPAAPCFHPHVRSLQSHRRKESEGKRGKQGNTD